MIMKYPIIEGNDLCDGLEHNIDPISLQSFIYNGVQLYLFRYYDLNHRVPAITFLRQDENGDFYKVPFRNYPNFPSFYDEIVLMPVPNLPKTPVILSDRVYESINDYCRYQHFLDESKKPTNKPNVAVARPQLPPDPPKRVDSKLKEKRPQSFSGYKFQSKTKEEIPCIALGYPEKNSIIFYRYEDVRDVLANFDGSSSFEYLLANLGSPIKIISGDYAAACRQIIEDGRYCDRLQKLPSEETPEYYNGNRIFREEDHLIEYNPRYFTESFIRMPIRCNISIDGKDSMKQYNFISNYFFDVESKRWNSLIDMDYERHVTAKEAVNISDSCTFTVYKDGYIGEKNKQKNK